MDPRAWLLPLALFVAACTSPIPTPTPSPAPSPSPQPTPTLPPPSLHIDGLATIAREGVRLWLDPAGGDSGRKKDFLDLAAGTHVLLVDGPLTVDGIDYWQVFPSTRAYETELGWVAAEGNQGNPNLVPIAPACPAVDGITAAQ